MAREYEGSTAYGVSVKQVGAISTLIEREVTVGVAVTEVLNDNPRRLFWLICNRGGGIVYFGFSSMVIAASGFVLPAEGGMASCSVAEDMEGVSYGVYAISPSGNQTLRVLEVMTL